MANDKELENAQRTTAAALLGAGLGGGLSATVGGDALSTGTSAAIGALTLGTLAHLINRKLSARKPLMGPAMAGSVAGTLGAITGAGGAAAFDQTASQLGKKIADKAGFNGDFPALLDALRKNTARRSGDNFAKGTLRGLGRGAFSLLDYIKGVGVDRNILLPRGFNDNGKMLPPSKASRIVGPLMRNPKIGVGLGTGALAAVAAYKLLRNREE